MFFQMWAEKGLSAAIRFVVFQLASEVLFYVLLIFVMIPIGFLFLADHLRTH